LTNASAVAADITHVSSVLKWNPATQLFRFYSPTSGGDNFTVKVGDAIIVLVNAGGPIQWP